MINSQVIAPISARLVPPTRVVRQPGVSLPEVVKHLDAAVRPPALHCGWVGRLGGTGQHEALHAQLAASNCQTTWTLNAPPGTTTLQHSMQPQHAQHAQQLACSTMEGAEYISPAT